MDKEKRYRFNEGVGEGVGVGCNLAVGIAGGTPSLIRVSLLAGCKL